jgi:hypothetical protein
VIALLRSLRSLIFGETWTVPLGVAAALGIALLLRAELPGHVWHAAGGFMVAALVAATLLGSTTRSSRR